MLPDLFISTTGSDADVVRYLNQMFYDAAVNKVADIQLRFSSYEQKVEVQAVGSAVTPFLNYQPCFGADWYEHLDSKIRSRARFDIADNVRPLDGRMRLIYKQEDGWEKEFSLDIRISIIPTNIGQTIVMRVQRGAEVLLPFDQLEMTEMARVLLSETLSLGQGMVVVCGPTGSGKTTLLFSLLLELLKEGKNIKTIEDPVEYTIDGIDQVSRSTYLSFADAIAAFMRQHPHVLLVGEVRDRASAEAATQAAKTGHLVFITTHADSAVEAFGRLRDLGMDNNALSDSVKLVIGQRLLHAFTSEEQVNFGEPSTLERFKLDQLKIYKEGEKFPLVGGSKMKGRVPLMEIIKIDHHIKKVLKNMRFNVDDLCEAASLQPQYESLIEGHVRLARLGRTTLKGFDSHPLYSYKTERLDQVLLRRGDITPLESYQVIDALANSLNQGIQKAIWEIAIDIGVVTLDQVFEAVGRLPSSTERLVFYIEGGHLTRAVTEQVIEAFNETNQTESIFEILKQKTELTDEIIYDKKILYYWSPNVSAVT